MLDDLFGDASWPAAFFAAVLVAAFTWTGYTNGQKDLEQDKLDTEVKTQIIQECSNVDNPEQCGEDIKLAIDAADL